MELDVPHAVLLRPGEGETVTDRPERTIRILFEHDLLVATWTRYEPGERGPDPHVHRRHTDAFYVLEGELLFELGPELTRVPAPAGTFVAAPPNVVHSFANDAPARACFLNFHSPGAGFGENLRGHPERFDSFDPPEDGGEPLTAAAVSPPAEGERYERPNRTILIKAQLPHLALIELVFRPGWEGVDPHTHDDHVDSFYVLQGHGRFATAGLGGPGAFVAAPPGAVHGFRLEGGTSLAVLNVHAPDTGFTDRLRSPSA